MVKVTVVSPHNWANCGGSLARALRYVGADAGLYAPAATDPFGFGFDVVDRSWVSGSDIVHVIDDMPAPAALKMLKIETGAPLVQTVIGSSFRTEGLAGAFVGRRYKLKDYFDPRIVARAAVTPDLLYPEYDGEYLPNVTPVEDAPYDWEYRDPPRFVHCPSNAMKKGTLLINRALAENRRPFIYHQTSMLSHADVDRARDGATVCIDQIGIGWYATAALEAMARGIPTMAWIYRDYGRRVPKCLADCPIIDLGFTASQSIRAVSRVLKMDRAEMEKLSLASREYVKKYHGLQAVGSLAMRIYKKALEG